MALQTVIIDDMQSDRFFLRRQLHKVIPDCEVKEFAYAEEALSYLKTPGREDVDLIFVDINMPRMSGFDFADAFEALYDEIKGTTRVHIVSSSINPDDEAKAAQHPAVSGFVIKPTSTDALTEIIYDTAENN